MKNSPLYISDLSVCSPATALSERESGEKWQLFPYETQTDAPHRGVMIGAPSFVSPPQVTLELNVSGWHSIHIGYWIPRHDYDGGTTIKVRLDSDVCFTRLGESEPAVDYKDGTCIREAFFKTADLTGRTLVFGKLAGVFAEKAYIAFVRLTPLSASEVAAVQADQSRTDTRKKIVCSTIDGLTYLFRNEYSTAEHLLELVEHYRYSDVKKVTWGFCYGDATNYPTQVGTWWAAYEEHPAMPGLARNPHVVGMATARRCLRELHAKGIIPQQIIADHVHSMGIQFEAMFRLGIFGDVPPRRWGSGINGLLARHPEFRQVMADGTAIEKASYAFAGVRDHMTAIIREVAENFDVDGVSLCFVRGPAFTAFEQPVRDEFERRFNGDARKVSRDDPRMQSIVAHFLTEFVQSVRSMLDDVGRAKGKRFELSAWVHGQMATNRQHGFDVEEWIRQGWIDSIVGFVGQRPGPFDPDLMALANTRGCRVVPGLIPWQSSDLHADAEKYLFPEGAQEVAIWDTDHKISDQQLALVKRLGHRKEGKSLDASDPEANLILLKSVAGVDVAQGLGPAAYSCG